jgi:hypothetical protein
VSRYDFKSLSPQDFEELARDLLQAHWQVALEAFRAGRDQGVDLRYAPAHGGSTVVQCKHYAGSGVSTLVSHLRNSELPKVQRLNPDRYVVVTSLALSKSEKDQIFEVLQPYIRSTGDVIAAGDLEGLLGLHPQVERANFKLWLTSTEVLGRVLHNAEHCTTDFKLEQIRKKLPVFVQSDAFPRAQLLLDEQRVAVISGAPGIGKTTLAEMLLYAHVEQGFEPVVLETDLVEGKRLFRPGTKQFFYYDDFLGQTFLGDMHGGYGRNYDQALVNFMEMVKQTAESRFVLTTREHILRQAFQSSERFSHSHVLTQRCVLELGDYAFRHRARILYNHLYFSDLPGAHKEALLADDFFLEIIKHEHFNPRLIEWLATLGRLGSPPPERYCERVASLLRSPHEIWSHAFHNQLSVQARNLLLTLYTLGDWVEAKQLEVAFEVIHRGHAKRYQIDHAPADFYTALRELEGGFLTYRSGHASFLNPSVKDFIADVIARMPRIARELMEDSVRFKQLGAIWRLACDRREMPLLDTLAREQASFCAQARRLLPGATLEWARTSVGLRGYSLDVSVEHRLTILVQIADELESETFLVCCREFADELSAGWSSHQVQIDFRATLRALESMSDSEWYYQNGGGSIFRKLLDKLLEQLKSAHADDWIALLGFPKVVSDWRAEDEATLQSEFRYYKLAGLHSEQENCADSDDLSELRVSLKELNEQFGVDFTRQIASIDEAIADREEPEQDREAGSHRAPRQDFSHVPFSEEDARQMFQTLRSP